MEVMIHRELVRQLKSNKGCLEFEQTHRLLAILDATVLSQVWPIRDFLVDVRPGSLLNASFGGVQ